MCTLMFIQHHCTQPFGAGRPGGVCGAQTRKEGRRGAALPKTDFCQILETDSWSNANSNINFRTTFPDSLSWTFKNGHISLQIWLRFSSNPSNLVGEVFLCGESWPQLQFRNIGTPPVFKAFFLEKRPWGRFSTNVLIRGEMNPLHKHKVLSVGYQVKQNLNSRSWKLV